MAKLPAAGPGHRRLAQGRIRDRAALWIDATPQECLAAVFESCEEAAFFLSRLDPASLERALSPQPLPADTEEVLTRLWNSRTR
jgi:hypothetical protein